MGSTQIPRSPGETEVQMRPCKSDVAFRGSTILYTDRKELSPEQWERVVVNDSKNTTVRLSHLRQGTRYSVQIIPRLISGDSDYTSRALFEMKTDKPFGVGSVAPGNPVQLAMNQRQFQQMRKAETEHMRIVSCDPDAIQTGCAWDEMCITRVEEPTKGWCIPLVLRDSILNS
ncbi:hypothetical protein Y032_0153g2920 [Ancylostoma ceylanicum]|uniref:Fibronectin type-III domain-containing protein n=1 Tax=Ancylostoma ceylanicum TaxID=53326 RepID=A0A016SZI0_9BILA|nr:hypothetical protein Y032_0153g2920 [Ancylostoma ceylanicum]